MASVAGLFKNPLHANQSIVDLMEIGVERDNMTLMMSDKTRDMFKSPIEKSDRVINDTATGTVTGGVLGGLVAGLTSIAAISIPGLGILAVGPVVAALAGLGAGAAAGGVVGALVGAGFNQAEASKYSDAIKEGKAVLIVHNVDDEELTSIRSILSEMADSTKAA